MTAHGIERHEVKKPLEHVACFGVAVAILMVAALGIQWLMNVLIP